MKILVVPFALATAFGATAALAEPVAYDFDPSHSQVVFDYQHMGFSTSTGIINGVTGKLMLDAENPANSSVEATIRQAIDNHLLPDGEGAAGQTPNGVTT